jgi:hypothetical protein
MDGQAGAAGAAAIRGRLGAWRETIARVSDRYAQSHGRPPSLLRPRRYTEKVQWRKLFDLDPRYAIFCDKLATRRYVAERLGEAVLPTLLWAGLPEGIPFDTVSPPYVFKSSHGSGQFLMLGADAVPDRDALRALGRSWLGFNHGRAHDEPGYCPVPPRLMLERTVTTEAGARPEERRFFLFDGEIAVINTVFAEGERIRHGAFHRADWTRLDWHFSRRVERDFPRPARLDAMAAAVRRLGAGLDHVRIDVFDAGERFWIGEMTLYPWSGHARFNPDEADRALGEAWRLRRPALRALHAVLRRRPGELG